jgi:galactitol-specific phosphotransferase system IIC component
MALFNNGFKGNILGGLAIGIGAAVLAPVVMPVLVSVVKPLAKAAIKGGIVLYEKGREAVAEVSEMTEDIVAEAKAELAESQKEATTAGTPSTPGGEAGA